MKVTDVFCPSECPEIATEHAPLETTDVYVEMQQFGGTLRVSVINASDIIKRKVSSFELTKGDIEDVIAALEMYRRLL